jgi:hypothetical protein
MDYRSSRRNGRPRNRIVLHRIAIFNPQHEQTVKGPVRYNYIFASHLFSSWLAIHHAQKSISRTLCSRVVFHYQKARPIRER